MELNLSSFQAESQFTFGPETLGLPKGHLGTALGIEVLQVTFLDQEVEKSSGFHLEDACSMNTTG